MGWPVCSGAVRVPTRSTSRFPPRKRSRCGRCCTRIHVAFPPAQAEALRALLHQRPRTFDQPTSLWTLDLAAEVSFEQGWTPERVSGETIRATLARLGVPWQRAKDWITSPDPEYARNTVRAIT